MIVFRLLLILLFGSTFLSILFYFTLKNRRLKKRFYEKNIALSEAIRIEKEQIEFRLRYLNQYHFLRYNLSESLRVQSHIKVN